MDFNKIQNTKMADVERPPMIPPGTYVWAVKEVPTMEDSGDGKWKFVTFKMQAINPQDDVDQEALQKYGSLQTAVRTIRFIFNNEESEESADNMRAAFNLKTFLERSLGMDPNATLKENMSSCVGAQCLGPIRWRTDKNDPDRTYDEIGKTAPVA